MLDDGPTIASSRPLASRISTDRPAEAASGLAQAMRRLDPDRRGRPSRAGVRRSRRGSGRRSPAPARLRCPGTRLNSVRFAGGGMPAKAVDSDPARAWIPAGSATATAATTPDGRSMSPRSSARAGAVAGSPIGTARAAATASEAARLSSVPADAVELATDLATRRGRPPRRDAPRARSGCRRGRRARSAPPPRTG